MGVDVLILVALIFQAGGGVIKRCLIVQQCAGEAARIALRTQNVLGLLPVGAEELRRDVALQKSLLHLRKVLETILMKLERCKKPARISEKRAFRKNATKVALLAAEADLARVTSDLRLRTLADIGLLLDEMKVECDDSAAAGASTASAGSASPVGERDRPSSMWTERSQAREEIPIDKARGAIQKGMRARTGRSRGASVADVIRGELGTHSPVARSLFSSTESALARNSAASSGDGYNVGGLLARKRVQFERLAEGECLGRGTFGTVLAGRYLDRNVAIKQARAPIFATHILQEFRKEAELQFVLRHPNLVEAIAFSLGDDVRPPCLVMERMELSLFDYLDPPLIIDFTAELGIVLDVCKALLFLHDYGIVHRNIKSPNVLLDYRGKAKISDFNLANISLTVNGDTGGGFHSNVGPQFWTAPEINEHKKATEFSDIFSLHVVMWEVFSNRRAGDGEPIGEALLRAPEAKLSLNGSSCSAPEPLMERTQRLLDRCGSVRSQDRPKMNKVTLEVEALLAASRVAGATTTAALEREMAEERQQTGAKKQAAAPGTEVVGVPAAAEPAVQAAPSVGSGSWPPEPADRSGSWLESVQGPPRALLWSPKMLSEGWQSQPAVHLSIGYNERGNDVWENERLWPSVASGGGGNHIGSNREILSSGSNTSSTTTTTTTTTTTSGSGISSISSGGGGGGKRCNSSSISSSRSNNDDGSGSSQCVAKEEANHTESTSETRGGSKGVTLRGGGGGDDGSDSNCDGDEGACGAGTPNFGSTTAAAVAGVEGSRPPECESQSRGHTAYSIMTTNDRGFQRRFASTTNDEVLSEDTSTGNNAVAVVVVGAALSVDAGAEGQGTAEGAPIAQQAAGGNEGGTRERGRTTAAAVAVAAAVAALMGGVEPSAAERGGDDQSETKEDTPASEGERGLRALDDDEGRRKEQADVEEAEVEEAEVAEVGVEEVEEAEVEGTRVEEAEVEEAKIEEAEVEGAEVDEAEVEEAEVEEVKVDEAEVEEAEVEEVEIGEEEIKESETGEAEIVEENTDGTGTEEAGEGDNGTGERVGAVLANEGRRHRPHDRAVLMALFERCGGVTWSCGSNWGSDKPMQAWYNVTIDGGGHVAKLTLPRNKLDGHLPAEMGMLAFLCELRLHRNSLRGRIPPLIGGLSSLVHLDLHGNSLCGPIPPEIGNLSLLREAYLQENELTGGIPPQLGGLASLQSLNLSCNTLEGQIPEALGDLGELEELMLSQNQLSGTIPKELGALKKLKILTLNDNNLSGIFPPEVKHLTRLNLEYVDLTGTLVGPSAGWPEASGSGLVAGGILLAGAAYFSA